MNKNILLLTFLIGITIQTCTKGCLKCTTDNKCVMCDITSKYKLASDSCSLADQPNCDLIDLNGDCMVCSTGYWLNASTKKCVVVETAKVVTNCSDYSSTQACVTCKTGYIIDASQCKAVEKPIANCDEHKSATTCGHCNNGYFVSRDEKTCEIAPTISNCNRFSRYECAECSGTHILNRNFYFNTSYKTGTSAEKNDSLMAVLLNKAGFKILLDNLVCQEITSQNCTEFETFDTCKTCVDGYFLKEDKTCQAYPVSIILNCSIYSSNTTCSQCNQGFFRVSATECKAVTAVDNCSEYSTTANTTQCIKCNAEFFLASASSCTARTISAGTLIANCKSKQYNADKCGECNTGFVLASGGDQCVATIANCKIHNTFNKGTTPTCNTCIDTFYLSSGACVAGNVANCVIYNNNGTCSICKNGYYVNGNECTQHQNISNCKNYNNTIKDTCDLCENNTFNFKILKKCKLLTEIANCISYDHDKNSASTTNAHCNDCAVGYALNQAGTSCDLISVSNCADGSDANTCTECKDGFAKINKGSVTCVNPYDFLGDQCAEIKSGTTGNKNLADVECQRCKLNAITVDYDNQFACLNNDFLADTLTAQLATPIAGCIKYDNLGATPKCLMCESSKYLKYDGQTECLSSCSGPNLSILNSENGDDNGYYTKLYNVCYDSGSPENTALWGSYYNSWDAIKCKDNKVTRVDMSINNSVNSDFSIVDKNGSFGNWIRDPADQRVSPTVSCPLDANVTNINGVAGTTLIQNCEYYSLLTGTNYGCLKCKHGYSGKPSSSDPKYLSSCESQTECDSSTSYGNIPVYWSKLFSCHKCLSSDKIPYIFYQIDTNNATVNQRLKWTTYKRFTLTDATNWQPVTINNESSVIRCLTNGNKATFKTDTNLTVSDSNVVFVDNCGLGLFDLTGNTKSSFDSSNIAANLYTSTIFCAACKPGYKPTFGRGTNILTPTACTQITNCSSTSTWFNACSQCNTGFVIKYDNTNGLDYTQCVAYTVDNNCYAATANNTECSLCKKGFAKNKDGYCVTINTPKCQEGKYSVLFKTDKQNDYNYLLWYNEQGPGCNQCDSGYTAVKYGATLYQKLGCASSSYIATNGTNFPKKQDGTTKSSYINNCESYEVKNPSSDPVCSRCNANYVLKQDGSACVSIANCLTALTDTTCQVCKEGFGLVSGSCVAGNIANCSSYNTNSAQSTVTCTQCNKGFYLNDKACEEGGVANCFYHTNNSKFECNECEDGYFLIEKNILSGTNRDYCYKFDSSLECSTVTIANSNISTFSCDTCSKDYSVFYTPSVSEIQTMCMSYNLIENCESYNLGTNLSSSTLLCSVCKSGFFAFENGRKCVARTVKPVGCKTYVNNADLCSECNSGNFLSANQKDCIVFPSGVIGCTTYTNATTCTACSADKWLSEGKCVDVLVADKVANCELYSNSTTCSRCQSGFTLEGNTCAALNVANCDVIASKDACESCLLGFRLKTENGKTTCEAFTKPNCAEYDQTGTNPCLQCQQNFYIDANGDCAAVTPIITNCLVNETKETCKVCAKGFGLAKDKKSCIDASAYDSNCNRINMPDNMSCSQCSPGHYFKDGVCTAFSGKSITTGCFSQQLDDNKVCLFCTTGYYMNSSGACVKIDDGNTPNPEPENTGIIRSLILTFFALMFMF